MSPEDIRTQKRKTATDGISRRAVLKGLGVGIAATALAPTAFVRNAFGAALQQPADAPTWTAESTDTFAGAAIFNRGAILLNGMSLPGGSGEAIFGAVTSIDAQTGQSRWRWQSPAPNFRLAAVVPTSTSVLALVQDGSLYALDPHSGAASLTATLPRSDSAIFSNDVFYLVGRDLSLTAADLTGKFLWKITPDLATTSYQPIFASGALVMVSGTVLSAYDAASGERLWLNNDSKFQQVPALGAGSVYAVMQTSNGTQIVQIDQFTGMIGWQSQTLSANVSAPAYSNGVVYIGDDHGLLYAIDAATGATLWNARVADHLAGTTFFFEDGIAYGTAQVGGRPSAIAVDLTQRGASVVSWAAPAAENIQPLGVQSGVCYVQGRMQGEQPGIAMNVYAIPLANVIHEFFAESELMADNYVAVLGRVIAQAPAFRSHIRVVDEQKNPRANKSIKIWASAPVTVVNGGKSYPLDTKTSVWIDTDALGELSLVTYTAEIDTPALYMWSIFMAPDETIVIYPDHDSVSRLAGVQGADLQAATTFDGTAIVPSYFTGFDDLASMMRGMLGNPGSSLAATQRLHTMRSKPGVRPGIQTAQLRSDEQEPAEPRISLRDAGTRYIAFPGSNRNLVYQPVVAATTRQYVPGNGPQSWTAAFAGSGITFTPNATLALPGSGSIWHDIKKFADDCYHGAKHIAKTAWHAAEATFWTVEGDIYQFTVSTFEDAITCAKAVFKTICKDISKVVEWLSWLFNWKDILSVKDQMKSKVEGGFNGLLSWLNNQKSSSFAGVNSFFGTMEGGVQAAFSAIESAVGAVTLQSKQQNGNDPQAFFGAFGAKSYAKTHWLITKVRDNLGNAKISTSGGVVALALTEDPDPIITGFKTLAVTIGQTLESTAAQLPDDLRKIYSRFAALASDPSQFVTHTIDDLLQTFSEFIVEILKFANAIVDDILTAMISFVQAVIDTVEGTIEIPFVSDLYRAISGSSLSIIDLACLLMAIPTTIIQKAMAGVESRRGDLAITVNDNLAYAAASVIYAVFDPLMDLFEDPSLPEKALYIGVCTVLQGLNFPTDIANNRTGDYVFYAVTAVPLVISVIDIAYSIAAANAESEGEEFNDEGWSSLSPILLCYYGVAMSITSGFLGWTDPVYRGKDSLLFFQNLIGSVVFIPKPLVNAGDKGRAVVAAIDGVCDLTTAGLGFAQHFV